MDGQPTAGEPALWSFLASVATIVVTQIGIAWRTRIRAEKKHRSDDFVSRHDIERALESKDAAAFKFLIDRLSATEAAHKACEARAEEMFLKVSKLDRMFDRACYGIDILKGALEGAGIKVPTIPALDRT